MMKRGWTKAGDEKQMQEQAMPDSTWRHQMGVITPAPEEGRRE